MGIADEHWMHLAYEQALQARKAGEVPVGAVIVDAFGNLVGSGFNQVIQKNDPTAHAEMVALRNAAQKTANYRLNNMTLYVTLEPCCMCAGALVQARIQRVVFAARDFKAGAAGSVCNLLGGKPFNHPVVIDEGMMMEECAFLLKEFFRERR